MLLIDIGNTRAKWATMSGDALGVQQAAVHAGWTTRDVHEHIVANSTQPSAAWVSNVGGSQLGQLISSAIKSAWQIEPEFIRTSATTAGVRCGYAQPEKLGVDRWLSVIAAYHRVRSNACVVSVGTAMTIDAVLGDGQHLGGVIVPGPEMMVGSLMKNTSDIARNALDGEPGAAFATLFADNTLAAISQGSTHALAALIERCVSDMRTTYGIEPALVVTGGASERVTRELRVAFDVVPDLVLRGLSIAAKSASRAAA